MIVFGGVMDDESVTNEVRSYNVEDNTWTMVHVTTPKEKRPSARSGHTATLVGKKIVVWGGWDEPTLADNTVWIFDLGDCSWSQLETTGKAPCPRFWHTATLVSDTQIFIHGGMGYKEGEVDISLCDDIFMLDLETSTWSEMGLEEEMPSLSALGGHTTELVDGHLIMFGGGNDNNVQFNDWVSMKFAAEEDEDEDEDEDGQEQVVVDAMEEESA
eukprot:TRINITY_DN1660_c2_g1_i3.p1 TRINITY_DN1660_c2_g1~~TRINITY_DN1660_c2_g1_i3.p1  ORF type:complete len:215 (-),score=89.63 TRINITY_DN1660_c2_g1_i3:422-1066(-)